MQVETSVLPVRSHRRFHASLRRVTRRMLRRWQGQIERASVVLRLEQGWSEARLLITCHDGRSHRVELTHGSPRAALVEGLRRAKRSLSEAA